MKKITLILSFVLAFNLNAIYAQQKDSLIKVTEGVYEITGFFCNITFLITDDGVILFDTGNYPEKGNRIQEIIRSVTDKPIKYIVYTHYHGDHTNGIALFPSGIPIIAQKNTVKNLKNQENNRKIELENIHRQVDSLKFILAKTGSDKSPDYVKTDSVYKVRIKKADELQGIRTVYPTIIVDSFKTIVLGKDTIEFIYPGKAHTDGDLISNIKTRKTMVCGDLLFNTCFPYIDPLGDVANWSNKMKLFAQSGTKYFIPGHCNIANRDDVINFANYLNDLRTEVKKMKDEGKSIEEIKKTLKLPAYDNFGFIFLREQNIDGVYGQLK